MPLKLDLETAAITLPLDVVLEMLRTIRKGALRLPEETEGLLKIEVGYVLSQLESVEDEVLEGLMKDAFGAP